MDEDYRAMDGLPSPSDFLPHSPLRQPDWRWRRAAWLVTQGQSFNYCIHDDWVGRAQDYQLARQRPSQGGHLRQLSDRPDTVVTEALHLAQQALPEQRLRLEAYLLTIAPFGEVAARCATSVEVVEVYHQLFFSVRDHLTATDWIMTRVVGAGWWEGFDGRSDALLKFIAYTAGAQMLELVLAVREDCPLPSWVVFPHNAAYQETRLRLAAKLTLVA